MDIESLPCELLLMVCQRLDYQDIISLSLATRTFSQVCQQPLLWRHFKLSVGNGILPYTKRMLENKRFSCLEEITFIGCEILNKHARILLRTNIKKIKIGCAVDFDKDCCFRQVDPSLLGRLVNSREGFYFYNWELGLTEDQLREIFLQMSEGTDLKCLAMNSNQRLGRTEPCLYSLPLNKLETVSLPSQDDISFQEFVTEMSKSTNITELDLSYNNLVDVEPNSFSAALSHLKESIRVVTKHDHNCKFYVTEINPLLGQRDCPTDDGTFPEVDENWETQTFGYRSHRRRRYSQDHTFNLI